MSKLEAGSKILIANDSVGLTGVQISTKNISEQMIKKGYKVVLLQPTDKDFLKITMPIEKQFKWTLFATPVVSKRILEEKPDAILITTVEAPIGKSTKDVCQNLASLKIAETCPFTLMYTTNHGLFLNKTIENALFYNTRETKPNLQFIEEKIINAIERDFINNRFSGAKRVLVNAKSSKEKLEEIGIKNIVVVPRGINLKVYHLPSAADENPYLKYDWYQKDPKPILLYLGRVAFEKDIHLFLEGSYPAYHRVVAGSGPALHSLRKSYDKNNIHFIGSIPNEYVPGYFMYARLSFFPSSFDTFGLTIIESAACGTPVVAFDVPGPQDVIKYGVMGITIPKDCCSLFEGLSKALDIDRSACADYTRKHFSWKKTTKKILNNLYPIKWGNGAE